MCDEQLIEAERIIAVAEMSYLGRVVVGIVAGHEVTFCDDGEGISEPIALAAGIEASKRASSVVSSRRKRQEFLSVGVIGSVCIPP